MTTEHDPLHPAIPAGAHHDLLARVLPQARAQKTWEPDDGPMPALFVSHGAPQTLDDPQWLDSLFMWSQSMPKPRAIVVVSAHWENAPLAISGAAAGTPLYYDFGGFHPRYYTLQYTTPDATHLARRIAATLSDTTSVHHYVDRGTRPWRLHPSDGHVPSRRRPCCSAQHAQPGPRSLAEARSAATSAP